MIAAGAVFVSDYASLCLNQTAVRRRHLRTPLSRRRAHAHTRCAQVINNRAGQRGGGIFSGLSGGQLELQGTLIGGNVATLGGGAFSPLSRWLSWWQPDSD